MNQAEVSGLLCAGLHDTNAGEQSYATECLQMDQDPSHETIKFEVSITPPAMHNGCSNSNSCLDEYQHTGIMAGRVQSVEEVNFGSIQHLEGRVSDSDEESLSSSPETSSTTNYGYMEQNIYNTLDEMVDKEGLVMLIPEFVLCDTALHLQPHLTFSSDGFKIEYLDCDSREDDEMIALYWDVCDIISINSKWTQAVQSASITLIVRSSSETKSSGPTRVEFCLTDPKWPQKQEKICYLASRYHEIWSNTPSEDFALENWSEPSLFFPKQYFSGTEDFEDVIYPKGDRDAVSISSRDVDLLLPETFVNDTIIDFYIKYLSTGIRTTERCRYHFFNSFFFRKLADLDKDQGRAPEGRSAFLRVRKWTRKIDIFAKDFLFIPVNFSLHWSLIVICHPGEVVRSEDDEAEKHAKVPCILHMDSLKGSHSGLKDIIQSYLWEEWKERHPEATLDISDKFLNLRFVPLELWEPSDLTDVKRASTTLCNFTSDQYIKEHFFRIALQLALTNHGSYKMLPQQDNSFDCGLFLLHYVELFLMDAPSSFNPLKIDEFSTFLSDNWFVPAEASLKRSLIRKLIHELVKGPSQNFAILTRAEEQFDEKHQISENAEQESAIEFLAQGCSAGETDSVCQIPGTRQESTLICSNNPAKDLPVSGFGLETAEDTMFAVQDMQICPPEGAKALQDDGCLVKDRDTYEEPALDYLHNNQEISSQAEAKVHDTMDSEVMACKQQSLETNINEVVDGSEDRHPVAMSDSSNDDIVNDPESTKGEAEDDKCDIPDVMGIVAICDINGNASGYFKKNGNASGCSLESSVVKAEEAIGNISDDTGSLAIGELNKDVSGHSFAPNAVESEDMKHEDTHGDAKVEDDIKINMNETDGVHGDVNVEEDIKVNTNGTCIAVDEIKGNTDNLMTSGRTVSCESSGTDERAAVESVPGEDDTTCTDADMQSLNSSSCAEIETVCEDKPCDAKRPLPDSTTEVENIQVSDGKRSQEDVLCTEEKQERSCKRRKVVASGAADKRRTRSSSRTPSLE